MKGYTHLAKAYGIKCFYNIKTKDIKGITLFHDYLIDLCLRVHILCGFNYNENIKVKILKNI